MRGLRIWSRRHLILIAALGLPIATHSPALAGLLMKRQLGPNVNTSARDCSPVVSPDGATLYFVRERYIDPDELAEARGTFDQISETCKQVAEGIEALEARPDLTPELRAKLRAAMRSTLEGCKRSDARLDELTSDEELMKRYGHHKIYVSDRQPDGEWGRAQKMPAPLNNEFPSAVVSALPDNNTLLWAGNRLGDHECEPVPAADGSFDDFLRQIFGGGQRCNVLWLVKRSEEGWSEPEPVFVEAYENRASRFGAAISPHKEVIVFALAASQDFGGSDLHLSFAKEDGHWTKPRNLGPVVNTADHEVGPFLAADGATLYFASDRPGGSGGFDIYMTRRLDNHWREWSEPIHLGSDVNTAEDDRQLTVDASGNYAFMTIGEFWKTDIWEFPLPEAFRPLPVAFVHGRVSDPDEASLGAAIEYERLRDGAASGTANSEPRNGLYKIALLIGEDYGFRASAAGYIAVSEHIDLTTAKMGQHFERDLVLVPLEKGRSIRLNNIFFQFNEARLLPKSKVELDRLTRLLREHPTMRIGVSGHTDSVGAPEFNLGLSESRAAAVSTYLVEQGIAADRLTTQGFGENRPVAPNDTNQGQALNRRVEFRIEEL